MGSNSLASASQIYLHTVSNQGCPTEIALQGLSVTLGNGFELFAENWEVNEHGILAADGEYSIAYSSGSSQTILFRYDKHGRFVGAEYSPNDPETDLADGLLLTISKTSREALIAEYPREDAGHDQEEYISIPEETIILGFPEMVETFSTSYEANAFIGKKSPLKMLGAEIMNSLNNMRLDEVVFTDRYVTLALLDGDEEAGDLNKDGEFVDNQTCSDIAQELEHCIPESQESAACMMYTDWLDKTEVTYGLGANTLATITMFNDTYPGANIPRYALRIVSLDPDDVSGLMPPRYQRVTRTFSIGWNAADATYHIQRMPIQVPMDQDGSSAERQLNSTTQATHQLTYGHVRTIRKIILEIRERAFAD